MDREQKTKKSPIDKLCFLFLVFLTGCIVGWIYEEIFYWITEGMLRNRGILYGPWLPIYGVGALGIHALKCTKKHPLLLFILSTVITGVVEYIFGYIGINYFGIKLWDYSGLFLNIQGIVCFRSVISFAFIALLYHYCLEPMAERTVERIPAKVFRSICLSLATLMITDAILSALFRTPITY